MAAGNPCKPVKKLPESEIPDAPAEQEKKEETKAEEKPAEKKPEAAVKPKKVRRVAGIEEIKR